MRTFIAILFLFIVGCNNRQQRNTTPLVALPDTSAKSAYLKAVDDSLINAERIDGPANIRDTTNGKLLFILNDNVIVTSTNPKNKWLQVGLFADLSQKQIDCICLLKGSKLFSEGKEVGQTVENIHLNGALTTNQGFKGELTGYTSVSNIKPNTIPENVFSDIINLSSNSLTITNFKKFIADFKFTESNGPLAELKGFQIDENWIDDPSPLLRLWLLFKDDKIYGVFHSRPLELKDAKTTKVKRGLYLSTFNLDDKRNQDLVNAFNSYIVQVD